jgi:4-aminobutyrate aminotransferase
MLGCGETTIRLSPPLIITQEQADIAMDVLEECIGLVNKENGATPSVPGKQHGA